MKVSDDPTPMKATVVAGVSLAETKSFKYLGALFNSEASCDEEVKTRLAIARQRMGELVPIWKSRTVSNRLKARPIKALVWPIVTYVSWTLNKELVAYAIHVVANTSKTVARYFPVVMLAARDCSSRQPLRQTFAYIGRPGVCNSMCIGRCYRPNSWRSGRLEVGYQCTPCGKLYS